MKRLKPLSALILIALALLLSGVKSGAQNLGPKPRPTTKSQTEQTERHNQAAQPSYTPPQPLISRAVIQTPPLQTPTASPTPQGNKEESGYIGFGLAINGLLALATLILAIVGICQARAAARSADAAKDSADIARRALDELEVPYVSIGQITPQVLAPREELPPGAAPILYTPKALPVVSFQFNLRNHGRSVAEVTSVYSQLSIVDKLPMPPEYSGDSDLSAFPIGPNSDTGSVQWEAAYWFPTGKRDEDFDLLLSEAKQLVCFGYIRYTDVFKTKWISGFGWRWWPHTDGVYLVGGSDYNYNRKDKQHPDQS
jgi:hypothetical protein